MLRLALAYMCFFLLTLVVDCTTLWAPFLKRGKKKKEVERHARAQPCPNLIYLPSAIGRSEKPGLPSFMTTIQTDVLDPIGRDLLLRKGRTATCAVDYVHWITKKGCWTIAILNSISIYFFLNTTNPLVRINDLNDALYPIRLISFRLPR